MALTVTQFVEALCITLLLIFLASPHLFNTAAASQHIVNLFQLF